MNCVVCRFWAREGRQWEDDHHPNCPVRKMVLGVINDWDRVDAEAMLAAKIENEPAVWDKTMQAFLVERLNTCLEEAGFPVCK